MPRARPALLLLCAAGCGSPPAASVVSAQEIGSLHQSAAIQGRDGGASARLWGRSVFTFGDTVLNVKDGEGQNWHHNSYAVTTDDRAADGIGPMTDPLDGSGAPRYLLAPTADEAAFNAAHRGDPCPTAPCGARYAVWPGAPVWDAAQRQALIPYGLIYAEPGDFNFRGVGQSFAVWRDLDKPPERPVVAQGAHPTLLFGEGETAPETAPLVHEGALYAFSCPQRGLGRPCALLSAPLAQVLVRSAWRVWDGSGWSADLSKGQDLFDGAPILSVHYNGHLSAWLAVYSAPLSNDVELRSAPALTGPWSDAVTLFTADHGASGWAYDALPHPEFSEDGGRVLYITYSRPTGETWFSARFPLVRVELRRAR